MKFTVCPFCGVASDTVHDSQQACIRALQTEIERTRQVLTQVGDDVRPGGASRARDARDEDAEIP
jgi:hypothetical protein